MIRSIIHNPQIKWTISKRLVCDIYCILVITTVINNYVCVLTIVKLVIVTSVLNVQ